jgi:hypothetical protein
MKVKKKETILMMTLVTMKRLLKQLRKQKKPLPMPEMLKQMLATSCRMS